MLLINSLGDASLVAKKCKLNCKFLSSLTDATRSEILRNVADELEKRVSEIICANNLDLLQIGESESLAFRDRLILNEIRILGAAEGLRNIANQPDPLGQESREKTLPNNLLLKKVSVPLGVIFLIFESRPNVAIEALGLSLKSGNFMILRSGREALNSVNAILQIFDDVLRKKLDQNNFFCLVGNSDRAIVKNLLFNDQSIDVVIPRGGSKLIDFVAAHARMPVIKNDRGLCHVYVHEKADIKKALAIVTNAKTSRPGVCNAMETLLVDEHVSKEFLEKLYLELIKFGVRWFCCEKSLQILGTRKECATATSGNFQTEYLDLQMNCKVVSGLSEAMTHIEAYGSRHSEAIVTESASAAMKFQSQVDAAVVYWNASTRFTDGGAFGMGGELGISTQKLHVRGPVGLTDLTCAKWVVTGNGQIRET